MSDKFVWNDATIERLRTLWDSGMATAAIGAKLHMSKNAVVGKAHRLGLTPRASPIIAAGEKRPVRLNMAASKRAAAAIGAAMVMSAAPAQPAEVVVMPEAGATVQAAVAPMVRALGRAATCQFPLWSHAARPGLRPQYCEAAATFASYCGVHAQRCFISSV